MLQKTAYFKPFSAIFWLNLSAILDFGALETRYDQINVRNGFLMFKLVENEFLITLIAQKLRILKMPDFLMAAILDCILPPYAPDPICPPDSKLLFRVHTTINHHKILRDKPCKRGQLPGTLLYLMWWFSQISQIYWVRVPIVLSSGCRWKLCLPVGHLRTTRWS